MTLFGGVGWKGNNSRSSTILSVYAWPDLLPLSSADSSRCLLQQSADTLTWFPFCRPHHLPKAMANQPVTPAGADEKYPNSRLPVSPPREDGSVTENDDSDRVTPSKDVSPRPVHGVKVIRTRPPPDPTGAGGIWC